MRPGSAGFAALAALLALAAVPTTAGAGRAMELGIQDASLFAGNPPVPPAPLLGALGIQRERIVVPWRAVERRPGAYQASRWASAAAAARARDHRVSIVLAGPAPPWAARDAGGYRYPDPGRYAAFAGAVARQLAPYVARYSVWDEPNRAGRLAPQSSAARQYAALFAAGAAAIRVADPGAEVLFGELQPGTRGAGYGRPPLAFLREAFCAGRRWRARCNPGIAADGVALHPPAPAGRRGRGQARGAVTMGRLGALARALDRLARGGGLRPAAKRRALVGRPAASPRRTRSPWVTAGYGRSSTTGSSPHPAARRAARPWSRPRGAGRPALTHWPPGFAGTAEARARRRPMGGAGFEPA